MAAWLRAYNTALAADLPDDPRWGLQRLRDYLTVTMPGERRLTWLAEDEAGEVLGYGRLLMLDGLGVLELYVVPGARRRGVGPNPARHHRRPRARGGLHLAGRGGHRRHRGGRVLSGPRLQPRVHGDAQHPRHWPPWTGPTSSTWPTASSPATGSSTTRTTCPMRSCPATPRRSRSAAWTCPATSTCAPARTTPERLRASLRCLRDRGLKPYIVVAIHERTGRVAGLTELVVPAQHPTRADQYDTTIVP